MYQMSGYYVHIIDIIVQNVSSYIDVEKYLKILNWLKQIKII